MTVRWEDYFEYDETCESCLRWKVERRSGNLLLAVPGQMAGSASGTPYYRVQLDKKLYAAHRVIWEMFNGPIGKGLQVDHKDLNKMNNKIENLRPVTRQVNCRNRHLRSDSSTGINGVRRRVRTRMSGSTFESWVARYQPLNGARTCREFSIGKYGEEQAKKLALDWLETIKDENKHIDMYSENHGKRKTKNEYQAATCL